MPDEIGKTYENALTNLEEFDVNIIKIGEGENVIGQYPHAKDDVYTKQKVFLLTDSGNITLPDFTGWTRKDIIAYWNLTNLPITLHGYGVAYEQSLAPGSIGDGSVEIIIKLREINYVEPVIDETNAQTEQTVEDNGE